MTDDEKWSATCLADREAYNVRVRLLELGLQAAEGVQLDGGRSGGGGSIGNGGGGIAGGVTAGGGGAGAEDALATDVARAAWRAFVNERRGGSGAPAAAALELLGRLLPRWRDWDALPVPGRELVCGLLEAYEYGKMRTSARACGAVLHLLGQLLSAFPGALLASSDAARASLGGFDGRWLLRESVKHLRKEREGGHELKAGALAAAAAALALLPESDDEGSGALQAGLGRAVGGTGQKRGLRGDGSGVLRASVFGEREEKVKRAKAKASKNERGRVKGTVGWLSRAAGGSSGGREREKRVTWRRASHAEEVGLLWASGAAPRLLRSRCCAPVARKKSLLSFALDQDSYQTAHW
eukprot:344714-Chlamydomonas_euryale.AAC.1